MELLLLKIVSLHLEQFTLNLSDFLKVQLVLVVQEIPLYFVFFENTFHLLCLNEHHILKHKGLPQLVALEIRKDVLEEKHFNYFQPLWNHYKLISLYHVGQLFLYLRLKFSFQCKESILFLYFAAFGYLLVLSESHTIFSCKGFLLEFHLNSRIQAQACS